MGAQQSRPGKPKNQAAERPRQYEKEAEQTAALDESIVGAEGTEGTESPKLQPFWLDGEYHQQCGVCHDAEMMVDHGGIAGVSLGRGGGGGGDGVGGGVGGGGCGACLLYTSPSPRDRG